MTYTVRMQYLDSQPLSFPWPLAVSQVPEQSVFANFYTLKSQCLYFFQDFFKVVLTYTEAQHAAGSSAQPHHHHNSSGCSQSLLK